MTSNDPIDGISKDLPNKLHSNRNFDRVSYKMKKPSVSAEGSYNFTDPVKSEKNGANDISILSDLPNLYKQNGTSMENLGYFIIPRSITSDPRYKSARLKYQKVLHVIFENVAFAPTTHAIGCEIIPIAIGQLCISIRGLVDLCNEGVKFKEDLIDKNIVERASHFWARCQFVRQDMRHGKTIITLTISEFYKKQNSQTETVSETKPRQNRDTKEEEKEEKEYKTYSQKKGTFVPSAFATTLLSEFYSSLFSADPDFPKESVKKTKTQYEAADRIGKKAKGDMNLIRKVIAYAHEPGGFWLSHVHSVAYLDKKFITLVQQLRNKGQKPMGGQKPQPKYNHDTTPSNPRKSISFAEEV